MKKILILIACILVCQNTAFDSLVYYDELENKYHYELFSDSFIQRELDRSINPYIVCSQFVNINFDLLLRNKIGSKISLNILHDVPFSAVCNRVEATYSGSLTWIGHLDGKKSSLVTLILKDQILAGNITIPKAFYQVRYSKAGIHSIYQINQNYFPQEANPIPVYNWGDRTPVTPTRDNSVLIDILVIYNT